MTEETRNNLANRFHIANLHGMAIDLIENNPSTTYNEVINFHNKEVQKNKELAFFNTGVNFQSLLQFRLTGEMQRSANQSIFEQVADPSMVSRVYQDFDSNEQQKIFSRGLKLSTNPEFEQKQAKAREILRNKQSEQ